MLRHTFQDHEAHRLWPSAHPSRTYLLECKTLGIYQRSSNGHHCKRNLKRHICCRNEQQHNIFDSTRLRSLGGSQSRHRRRRWRRCPGHSPDRRHCPPLSQASLESRTYPAKPEPESEPKPVPIPHRCAHAELTLLRSSRERLLACWTILHRLVSAYDVAAAAFRPGLPGPLLAHYPKHLLRAAVSKATICLAAYRVVGGAACPRAALRTAAP